MAMYECHNCGEEYSIMPKIVLSVDKSKHTRTWEVDFERLLHSFIKEDWSNLSEAWDKFYIALGRKHLLWFCSYKCAIEFLHDPTMDCN